MTTINNTKLLTKDQQDELLKVLQVRFENNGHRHVGIEWTKVLEKLMADPSKLWSLQEMESTGGEPDVVWYDKTTNNYLFCDCSPESPKGRRSLCYDREALLSRKEHPPKNTVMDVAKAMGVDVMTEYQYRELQKLGDFDTKTSSWIQTPTEIRQLGGALFCDRRYDHVFVYHNGADSYYGARAFRGSLSI